MPKEASHIRSSFSAMKESIRNAKEQQAVTSVSAAGCCSHAAALPGISLYGSSPHHPATVLRLSRSKSNSTFRG